MPLPVPASVKLKSMFGQCLNWKHQRIWRPKATGLARRLAYGCVGKLRPLQSEAGSGRRFFHLPCTVGGLVVVYPGRATDGDAGEQHMCSATCGFVGPWMDPTPRFQKIHGRVGERDVACHSRPITTSPPLDGVMDQAFRQALGPGPLSVITRFFMVALHTSGS